MRTRTMNAVYVLAAIALVVSLALGVSVLSPPLAPAHAPTAASTANRTSNVSADGGGTNGWQANIAACGSGALIGGTGGAVVGTAVPGLGTAVGAAVGAGVGCAAGFAGFHLGTYFAGVTAGSSALAAEEQFQLTTAANLNNFNLGLAGLVNLTQSQLLTTFNSWAAMADAVAPAELPNATFDPLYVLNESGIAIQMDTLANDYVNLAGSTINSVNGGETAGYGPGGTYISTCAYGLTFTSAVWGCSSADHYFASAGADMSVRLYNGDGLILRTGGTAEIGCATGGSGPTLHSSPSVVNGTSSVVTIGPTVTYPKILRANAATLWILSGAAPAGCAAEGNGLLGIPVSAGSQPIDNVTWVACGANSATPCDAANFSTRASTSGWVEAPVGGCAFGNVGHACVGPVYASPAINTFTTNLNNLFTASATNAKAYWLYLHLLGYNSSSQVPSNCIIPTPSQVLPPSYSQSIGTLTLNQTLSFYAAWMNALATFFNTPLNATNFCHGHSPFNLGFDGFWSLNVVLTGFAYTLPVAHQVFGTLATWTVNNASTGPNRTANGSARGLRTAPTQMVVYPSTAPIQLPIGRVQYVPINNPLYTFVPANGTLYYLQGNGTAQNRQGFSNGTASGTTGAALYVSTCSVLNLTTGAYVPVVTGYCDVQLSSIQNVSFPFSSSPIIPPPNGCAAASTILLGPFVSFWAALVGSSSLGCGFAEILGILTLLIIVVVVLYVIVAVVRRD